MMEIAAAGDDHKALRKIAAALLAKAAGGDVPAINALADRTDGKVATWSVVKLGLDRFLQEHADTGSEQADSAYADLVRLTGDDPVTEILAKLRP